MNHVTEMVGEHLHLDMAWVFNVLLNEDRTVAEKLFRFTRGSFQIDFQVFLLPNDMHTLATATCRSLNQDRERQSVGLLHNLLVAPHHAKGDRDTVSHSNFTRFYLITHQVHGLRVGTDKNQIVGFAGLSQLRTFREEAVARMDSVGSGIQGRIDDFMDVEVGVFQRTTSQRASLVCHASVQGIGVVVGKDSY